MTERKEPTEIFKYLRDLETRVLQYQFSVANWMIASALLLNGGALVALFQIVKERPEVAWAGIPFVVGLIAALLCGVCIWFNTVCVGEASSDRLNWVTLDVEPLDSEDTKSAERWDRRAWGFSFAAMTFLAVSIIMFGYGSAKSAQAIADAQPKATAMEAGPPILTDEQMRALENAGLAEPATDQH